MVGEETELKINLNILKKNYNWIILALILILGFYLRSYHLDYPVIGYHNTKEVHTLAEARSFYKGGDYLYLRGDYTIPLVDPPKYSHVDNFPLYEWIFVIGWKIFGMQLWVARLVTVFFALGAVVFTYLFVKKLFKREDIALLSAFFTSISPLLVFFGRNIQFDAPALFFMTAAIYFFLVWKEKQTMKNIVVFMVFFTLTGLTKYPFLIIAIPLLSIFPFETIKSKKYWKQFGIGALIFIAFILWFLLPNLAKAQTSSSGVGDEMIGRVLEEPFKMFTSEWWGTVFMFASKDNFTKIGVIISIIGLCISLWHIRKQQHRFLVAWAVSFLVYGLLLINFMTGHNYYQMPFVPLVAILISSALLFIASIIPQIKTKQPYLKNSLRWIAIILFFIIFMWPAAKQSIAGQFNTQFSGLDVAGNYINSHSSPDEMMFDSGHQDTGVVWHADRKATVISNLSELKQFEEKKNLKWIFIYQWGFSNIFQKSEFRNYINSNYSLKQVAFQQTQQGAVPIYFLFKKGGTFDETTLNEMLQGRQAQSRIYEYLSFGFIKMNSAPYEIKYINLE
ncbi:glycosyltransferase family 39 protein [Candidatus Woesearchaeota archaeon]|nr:glycosyltransferase family 39 protein [Candidatus Woesearchaeota archaeon]